MKLQGGYKGLTDPAELCENPPEKNNIQGVATQGFRSIHHSDYVCPFLRCIKDRSVTKSSFFNTSLIPLCELWVPGLALGDNPWWEIWVPGSALGEKSLVGNLGPRVNSGRKIPGGKFGVTEKTLGEKPLAASGNWTCLMAAIWLFSLTLCPLS